MSAVFTGIITDVGCLSNVCRGESGGLILEVETRLAAQDLEIGGSIACSGVCLTITRCHESSTLERRFAVDVSAETLSVSNIGDWQAGHLLNLEAALRVGDALGGHWVSGHVDGVGEVARIEDVGDGHHRWFIVCPQGLMGYIAERGSIAVEGCSLTVVEVDDVGFAFNMIPHTRAMTAFRGLHSGGSVHLEVDLLARYAARWMAQQKR